MAARMDADGKDFTRALGLGTITALTVAGWFRRAVDRNDYSTIFSVDNGTGDNWLMQTGVDGDTMNTVFDATTQQSMGVMTLNTWYFICLSTSGTTGNIFYRTAAQNALTTVAVSGVTANVNAATLRIGESPWGAEWWNGDCANVCMWLAALTAAEAYNESMRYVPYRYANLVGWYPFLKPELVDYSGNGRTLSGGTGATTSDGPPIPWYPSKSGLVLPPSAGGAPINVSLNRATETGTANTLVRSKNIPLTKATSTDLSKLLVPSRLVALNRSTETDLARTLSRNKLVPFTRATEASVSRSLTASKVINFGRATETSIARTLTKSALWFLLRATSTESAKSLSVAHNVSLGRAVGIGTARSLSAGQPVFVALGRAIETGTVRGLAIVKQATLSRAIGSGSARALTVAHGVLLGRTTGTGIARALGASHAVLLSRAVETDTSRAMTLQKIVHLVRSISTDSVGSLNTTQDSIPIDVGSGEALDLVDVDYGTPVRLVQVSSGLLVVTFTSEPGGKV